MAADVAIPRETPPVATKAAPVAVDKVPVPVDASRWGKWALERVTLTEGYFANMSAEGFETRTVVWGTFHCPCPSCEGVRMMEARETTRCSIVSGFEVERCCAVGRAGINVKFSDSLSRERQQ